ncbi:MAG TPA: hypothetical protein VGM03_24070 [Phycisphaerae bacterium]|jgi:hypothetical protein
MFDAYVTCFLPDLVDEGLDPVLDRLQGEVGASGITVPIATPPVAHVRRAPGQAGRILRSRGGVFIQTEDRFFDGTRIKPVLSNWLKGRNPLQQVTERCRARELGVRVEISCTLTGRIATRYPESATKTVLGDASPLRMCLINPDVCEWLRGLVINVCQSFAPAAIELADFHAGRPEFTSTNAYGGAPLDQETADLLSICFCESCRQTAARGGVDVAAAARAATVRIEQLLTGDARSNAESSEPLRHYRQTQRVALERVLGEVLAASSAPVTLLRYSGDPIFGETPTTHGRPIARMLAAGDVDAAVEPGTAEIRLPLAGRSRTDPQALVRTMTSLTERGLRVMELFHYAVATPSDLRIARQAIRFARRTAG